MVHTYICCIRNNIFIENESKMLIRLRRRTKEIIGWNDRKCFLNDRLILSGLFYV